MKFTFFAAALFFLAATLDVNGQTPKSAAMSAPELATSVSKTPDHQLPVGPNGTLDSLKTQQQSTYSRPDGKTRFERYVNSMVGPVALARQAVGAGIGTWRNSPEEWGGQWEGFGKRLASGFGKNVLKQTATYGLDGALKLDSHYYRSQKKDAGSKIKNALLSPVTARNASGKRVVGIPRIVGTYTSSIVAAEAWYPSRYDWKDGVRSGTISFGISAAYNLFKEFVLKK